MRTIMVKYVCTAFCKVDAETDEEILATVLSDDCDTYDDFYDGISQVFCLGNDGEYHEIMINT